MSSRKYVVEDKTLSRSIMGLIRDIHGNIRSRFMSRAQDMGFTMPQFLVMFELTSSGNMTMHELIGKLKLPKSTLSRVVEQLVEKKMIERTRPKDNRRIVMLAVTPRYIKGKDTMRNLVVSDIDKVLNRSKSEKILASLTELMEALK